MGGKENENTSPRLTKFTPINFPFNPKYHTNTNKVQYPSYRLFFLSAVDKDQGLNSILVVFSLNNNTPGSQMSTEGENKRISVEVDFMLHVLVVLKCPMLTYFPSPVPLVWL